MVLYRIFALWCAALLLFVGSIQAAHAQARNCNCPPDPDVQVTIAPGDHLLLGSFARPDAGRDFISMNPNGTRDIPANLNINDPTKEAFQAARVTVTGGSFCRFRIILDNRSSTDVQQLRVEPGAGYTLTTNRSGARGEFDAAGNFEFTLGARARVRSTHSAPFSETFDVTVEYR